MKTVFRYLKRYRVQSILAPVFKMLEALMDLIVPLVVADIIDVGIAGGNRPYIYQRIVLLIFLALLGMLFSFTAQYFAARASVGATTLLRQDLFDHIEFLSYTQIDSLGTSTLITRMTSDCNQVQTGLNMALRLLLRSPFIVFGAMIMAFTIDVRCALIFAVAIPVLAVVVLGIMLGTIPMYKNSQAQLDVILNRTRENLTGVRVLRAFCKEDEEVRRFDEENSTLTKMNEKVGRISALPQSSLLFPDSARHHHPDPGRRRPRESRRPAAGRCRRSLQLHGPDRRRADKARKPHHHDQPRDRIGRACEQGPFDRA